jgi:hypothetical protein
MRVGKIGVPDVFVEVSKRVEIFCLYPSGRTVSIGDSVPVEWFGFPGTCSFYNSDYENTFVCIADNHFIGIWEKPVYPTFDAATGRMIWDQDGDEAELVHDYFEWQVNKEK